ncbi:hypothetical protein HanIR_Chr17g0852591 [Helianthus annuus]|nr:hypothetical protein HanIR_Chr17g0852591 [Helianthus annuus]
MLLLQFESSSSTTIAPSSRHLATTALFHFLSTAAPSCHHRNVNCGLSKIN